MKGFLDDFGEEILPAFREISQKVFEKSTEISGGVNVILRSVLKSTPKISSQEHTQGKNPCVFPYRMDVRQEEEILVGISMEFSMKFW